MTEQTPPPVAAEASQWAGIQNRALRERIDTVQGNAERRREDRQKARRDPEKYVVELSERSTLKKSEVRWLQERGLGGYLSGSVMLRLSPQHARQALADPVLREQLHQDR